MSLSKDAILKADDSKRVKVRIPEWGGDVYLKVMSGLERDTFESLFEKSKLNARAMIAVFTVCDKDGNRLFEESDMEALGKKSGKVLDRIFFEAIKLNAITNEEIETLEKN